MSIVVWDGRRYERRREESVLEALVRGGADVAFSCRKGSCHTCVLRVVGGRPGGASTRGLHEDLVRTGHFKPCVSFPDGDLELAPADRSEVRVEAMVAQRRAWGADHVRLDLELATSMPWRPGQHVVVHGPDGTTRPWAIASVSEEDWYLTLIVERRPEAALAAWLLDEVAPGDALTLHGPLGDVAGDADPHLPLVIAGAGLGAPVAVAQLRDVLQTGRSAPVHLHVEQGSLPADAWAELVVAPADAAQARTPALTCTHVGAGQTPPAVAFRPDAWIMLHGDPKRIDAWRFDAAAAGVPRERLRAAPHASATPSAPEDARKLAALPPDPELWHALGEGTLLRTILVDFYTRVYADPRLAPFFHNATIERAIDKQYEFLRDVFSGRRDFLGLKPYNAHHWMVISDELFSYREALFESVLRAHGLDETMIRRWNALHERFRPEIVKERARGLLVDGKEIDKEGFSIEVLDVGSLCDGCMAEMPPGTQGRMHRRTGRLFCSACDAVDETSATH